MTEQELNRLGSTLWRIADDLRGAMNADDFRDYMLSLLFLRYLSDNYEAAAGRELGMDYPALAEDDQRSPLAMWYQANPADTDVFERQMRLKVGYVIKPDYLWGSISELARTQDETLLHTLQDGFKYIEEESFRGQFEGLFSEIDLDSAKLGKGYAARNARLCTIIQKIAGGIAGFSADTDSLGDAYEYLIGQFAAGSGKKAGEFYTPQQLSTILSRIVVLDGQDPGTGKRKKLDKVLDFACGSGSLLLNIREQMGNGTGKLYGQETNVTTYNLARMNMLLHGMNDSGFDIFHGDSLANDWPLLNEMNPAKKPGFDAVVANPPFSYSWEPTEEMEKDFRFARHGLAPKRVADFAFVLHGFHFLKDNGVMAIILPHGVLFRRGREAQIRTKLLEENHIDTVIGLPPNLFFSTGIPVCILVLKRCKKSDDVLFIDASHHFGKVKKRNRLEPDHIEKIVNTYQHRINEDNYSRCVPMAEIEENDYNLNIPRYVDTFEEEQEVELEGVNDTLRSLERKVFDATSRHNQFLEELDLPLLPMEDN